MKIIKTGLLFIGIILGVWIVGRFTGAIQLSFPATQSNYPTLEKGKAVFTSNLVQPKRFDLICYKVIGEGDSSQRWVHRLCGLEGDVVELREGVLFVNGANADKYLHLAHEYTITSDKYDLLEEKLNLDEWFILARKDSIEITLSEDFILENKLQGRRRITPKETPNEMIQATYQQNWNLHHFRPLTIPPGKCFVLGDNRDNSMDSRFTGFIDLKNVVSTVIGKR